MVLAMNAPFTIYADPKTKDTKVSANAKNDKPKTDTPKPDKPKPDKPDREHGRGRVFDDRAPRSDTPGTGHSRANGYRAWRAGRGRVARPPAPLTAYEVRRHDTVIDGQGSTPVPIHR
jgi:hypothetical protein